MKAMILAAGIGSRLRPLTDSLPKALIDLGGRPILEIVIEKLKLAGVTEIIVNTHHHAEKISEFLSFKKNFGIRIEISHEPELLDTGGGLKKAASFFSDSSPFYLHNADILSGIDLKAMMDFHQSQNALATLAVQNRESGRYLLFENSLLRGWENRKEGKLEWASIPAPQAERLAFAGIHVISPALLSKISENGAFSINRTYLRLAGQGERILGFRADGAFWADIGDAGKLETARKLARENKI